MSESELSAKALGLFSVGLGSAQLLAPKTVARLIGTSGGGMSQTLMRVVGARELAAGVGLLTKSKPASWLWARVAGDAMDLSLLGAAMISGSTRKDRLAMAVSAVGGVTLADLLSARRTSQARGDEDADGALRLTKAITIRRQPHDVYQFWRDFRNFPSFMSHVDSVAVLDDRHSHWTVRGPAGRSVEWDAEITEDRPDQVIAWRSLPGAQVDNFGRVSFSPAPGDRGTEVRVEIHYAPPGGELGSMVARLFGQEPRQQVQADLRKLKQVLEAGEVTRSEATLQGTHLLQAPAQPQPAEKTRGVRS